MSEREPKEGAVRSEAGGMKGLRIGVDGFNLALKHGTGIATYARTLCRTIEAQGGRVDLIYGVGLDRSVPERLRETIFFDSLEDAPLPRRPRLPSPAWFRETFQHLKGHVAIPIPETPEVEKRPLAGKVPPHDRIFNVPSLFRAASGFFKTTGKFLKIANPGGIDVMHWTYPLPIEMLNARNVYTIHDVVPLTLPYFTLDNKTQHRRLLEALVRQADALVTVSEHARGEIAGLFPAAAPKLHNFHQAIDLTDREEKSAFPSREVVSKFFGLEPGGYFLYYGALEPKKNIGRLLEAYLASSCTTPLVIVGSRSWKAEGELALLPQGLESGRIKKLEYLSAAHLADVVREAKAVIFPSIAEGFGLPAVEAMAFGTPVLTSAEGALAEVVGEAALKVDPYDVQALSKGMERLESDAALREDLRRKGPEQARRFNAAHYGARLQQLYRDLLKR
ncbi:glycosyltransferase family 1 protein [Oecophyllibacter saccharovorans]|nr:glycosyltransferase family 1 protein [Oecophyllibacter saccharovorans]